MPPFFDVSVTFLPQRMPPTPSSVDNADLVG